jgi:hypothetical protein
MSPLLVIRAKDGVAITVVFCSVVGLWLMFQGLRWERLDADGVETAPRWVYWAMGAVFQLPAMIYAYVWNRYF